MLDNIANNYIKFLCIFGFSDPSAPSVHVCTLCARMHPSAPGTAPNKNPNPEIRDFGEGIPNNGCVWSEYTPGMYPMILPGHLGRPRTLFGIFRIFSNFSAGFSPRYSNIFKKKQFFVGHF